VKQQEIEIILSRHWASHLTTPVFLVDPDGNLLYYNEAAEQILGRRFSETGKMGQEEWSTAFKITDDEGALLDPEELPLTIALNKCLPAHRCFWLTGLDNVRRYVETTCFPIMGQSDRFLGAIALFWELEE
jgi:PAS domain-containing protein